MNFFLTTLSEWHFFFFWKLANGVHVHASGPDPKDGKGNTRTKESRRARESKQDRQTRAQHGAAGQAGGFSRKMLAGAVENDVSAYKVQRPPSPFRQNTRRSAPRPAAGVVASSSAAAGRVTDRTPMRTVRMGSFTAGARMQMHQRGRPGTDACADVERPRRLAVASCDATS